jgi:hypothetical protein
MTAKESFQQGLIYGLIIAGTAYATVKIIGYNPQSLTLILYLYILSSVILNMKTELATPLKPLLKRIVIVAEGEEIKLKKLLTGEEYKINGDIEKL